jgi:hypothetical protein
MAAPRPRSCAANELFASAFRVLLVREDLDGADALACRATCRDARVETGPEGLQARHALHFLCGPGVAGVPDQWGRRLSNWLVLAQPGAATGRTLRVKRRPWDPEGETRWALDAQRAQLERRAAEECLVALLRQGFRACGAGRVYAWRHAFFGLGAAGCRFPRRSDEPYLNVRLAGCRCRMCDY